MNLYFIYSKSKSSKYVQSSQQFLPASFSKSLLCIVLCESKTSVLNSFYQHIIIYNIYIQYIYIVYTCIIFILYWASFKAYLCPSKATKLTEFWLRNFLPFFTLKILGFVKHGTFYFRNFKLTQPIEKLKSLYQLTSQVYIFIQLINDVITVFIN